MARLRKEYTLKPEFQELWERIRQKTRYAVKIDTERLLAEAVQEVDKAEIHPPRVTISKAQVQVGSEDIFEAVRISAETTAGYLARTRALPNLIEIMAGLMEHATPPVRLTHATLLNLFRRCQEKTRKAALENPQGFALTAVRIIREELAEHLIQGIQYEKINEWYEMTRFEDIPSWEEHLVPARRSVYDQVVYDSEIEREFVEGLEKMDDVKLYLKLPGWFTVDTPVGAYNPDWAIVMEERDAHAERTGGPLLYLVRETKPENWKTSLRPEEQRKIHCGERHFQGALQVDYKVVTRASELP